MIETSSAQSAQPRGCLGPDPAETELLRRAKQDPAALGQLYELHYPTILNYLYRRTLDIPLAEELTSNTFFHALKGLGRFDGRQPFRAWLYRIAVNELRIHWRTIGRRQATISAHAMQSAGRVHFDVSAAETQEDIETRSRLYAAVCVCMRMLSQRDQTVLSLRYIEGLSVEQVAQVMGKRPGTVKSLAHRALERLRKNLPKYLPPGAQPGIESGNGDPKP